MQIDYENGYIIYTTDDEYSNDKHKWIWHKLCQEFIVSSRYINVITNEIKLKFKWFDILNEIEIESEIISRADLVQNKLIPFLLKYGFSVNPSNINILIDYIYESEKLDAQTYWYHDKIGFINGMDTFFLDTSISNDDSCCESVYLGPDKEIYTPKGTYEGWIKAVKNYVMPYRNATLAFALAFIPPLIHILSTEVGSSCVLIELQGLSSTGKSTMLSMQASVFGACLFPPNESLIKTFNTTQQALCASLASKVGIGSYYDDSSDFAEHTDIRRMLYNMVSGQDKNRLKSDGSFIEPKKWSGTIFLNGEDGIIGSDCKEGIKVRSLSLCRQWTDSAEHSLKIKEAFAENYGHGAAPFIQTLMYLGKEKLVALHKKESATFIQCIKDAELNVNQFTERQAALYAVVLIAAKIVNCTFALNIDLGMLMSDLLYEYSKSSINRVDDTKYDKLKQEIIKDLGKYNLKYKATSTDAISNRSYVGNIVKNSEGGMSAEIMSSVFDEYCNRIKVKRKALCKELKESNNMVTYDTGRNTVKRVVNGISTRVNVIELDFTQTGNNPADTKRKPKVTIDDLLED